MTIDQPGIYHIYNRGNNQQTIFFSQENYFYFLRKCHRYLRPYADILAWCLMPNHFHFLLFVSANGTEPVKTGGIHIPAITNGFRLLQSSYAKGINKQEGRSGNLFQQKTKGKFIHTGTVYAITAFDYIHNNPVAAGLVSKASEWDYSSCKDYLEMRNGHLCNKEKTKDLLGIDFLKFLQEEKANFSEEDLEGIF